MQHAGPYLDKRIFIELIKYRQLTLCVPQFAGDPLESWGRRIRPAIGKSGPDHRL